LPDSACSETYRIRGDGTKPGRAVTSYVRFNPSGNLFIMCAKPNLERCIGPFIRLRGLGI